MEKKTLEEAARLIQDNVPLLDGEDIPVSLCLGRVLAQDVYADISYPPFARSAMDGYAVKCQDVKEASKEKPVVLMVTGCVYAGEVPGIFVRKGEAARIMTGAMIPEGADCIIRQEATDYGDERVRIFDQGEEGANCCMAGEDFQKGDRIGKKGNRIDAPLLAAFAVAGIESVRVCRRIRAAVITTGDELCIPGRKLQAGKIYDANMVYLKARLKEMDCQIVGAETVGDEPQSIEKALCRAAKRADIIFTTGGVSVGKKDYLPVIAKKMGGRIFFHGIRIKPGMPTMFFMLGRTPVLSLSGNPSSLAAVFEFFMPVIRGAMQAQKHIQLVAEEGKLANRFTKGSQVRRIIRGIVRGNEIYIPDKQANGMVRSGAGFNCLIDIAEGTKPLKEGSRVRFYRI